MIKSSLATVTILSPNCTKPRQNKICKLTPHHMAGNISIEQCGNLFANPARQASSNYGIGSDGRVACYVEEENRAWTSASPINDHQAITIEVANSGGAPDWKISDAAWQSLVKLAVDVCKRHGFRLSYTGDASGSLTRHNMFSATSCPGPYLQGRFQELADTVNRILVEVSTPPPPTQSGQYYPKPNYTGSSIVDALNKIGVNSSFGNRAKIAVANGIKNYSGTAAQNTNLLKQLKAGTLRRA